MDEMDLVRRVFVEKRPGFTVEADEILKDLKQNLKINKLQKLRVLNRYDVSGLTAKEYENAIINVFSEPVVDYVYLEEADFHDSKYVFAIESLPGQYNQRADSAAQCVQILTCKDRPECHVAQVIAIAGEITEDDYKKIINYMINPVESRQAKLKKPLTLFHEMKPPSKVGILDGFLDRNIEALGNLISEMGLAMSLDDLVFVQKYFAEQKRCPTISELRVLDTYWSDHCRHTTFLTRVESVEFDDNKISTIIKDTYEDYIRSRDYVYGSRIEDKPICLMDIATLAMKTLKRKGLLTDLDESEEINACSIKVPVKIDGVEHEYLVMFKNETHNHPTEIEPFGGAATCLGGAIRDPLSGRSYVYQAMRVTGSGDPTVSLDKTLSGKLSQRKITTKAASGYSSYGNQIGLATGLVEELYHPGYVAKRMEIGAVIAAAPAGNVVRERPVPGDCIILLGGRTGRDGCGGATGSSKQHDEESILTCGSEVQKGNPPTERKIQRLFRNPEVSRLIKRCNDFGAGGVCVAIGELADGLTINLDLVLKKYDGLDGTELAISESQERMAVVISPDDEMKFLIHAKEENLEAVTVARVISEPKMEMYWQGDRIIELSRDFINSNGAPQRTEVSVNGPDMDDTYFEKMPQGFDKTNFAASLKSTLGSLQCCSRKGLVEKFDGSIGAGSVLMPFGGKNQLSPESGMAAKIPVLHGESTTATLMTFGFDPYLSSWSPFHGAYFAVLESLSKIAVMGGDPLKARLTFQEYFERLGNDPQKWGKPFSALLGAYKAQLDFGTPAIGGKDSMSGTFKDLTVPPTLVSFAVGTTDSSKVISASFKAAGSVVVYLPVILDENLLPDKNNVFNQFAILKHLQDMGKVTGATTVREGGIAVAVAKMCFGNNIGFKFSDVLTIDDLFTSRPSGMIIELDIDESTLLMNDTFKKMTDDKSACILGKTTAGGIEFGRESVLLSECIESWESSLEKVFPTIAKSKDVTDFVVPGRLMTYTRSSPAIKIAKPRVFIPVFPGTNCEYDTARAFERAGAIAKTVIFNNLTPENVLQSIEDMRKAISESNILMIPGGFSGGDEPDGSGKFIAAAFKNPYLTEEIHKLLYERDGLALGICNGFQALIKLGLLPFGKITELDTTSPTLTYNTIGRHVSTYVRTKIVSNRSPWLARSQPGDIHVIPVSHGEGRFIASSDMIKALSENGQIATLYVDLENSPVSDTPFNPNGSMAAIEGITALDGRILGKMGHSERMGRDVAANIPGNKDQGIFESGVMYFS